MLRTGTTIRATCAILVALATPAASAPALTSAAVDAAVCGTALSPDELQTIADLSDTTTLAGDSMQRSETAVDRQHRITEILVSHRDRRGLFPLGWDAVEQVAVMPVQRDPAAFADRDYAHAISYELLRRFLVNLHAEFTGGSVEPQWAHYFEMARQCEISGARVAMAGYNAQFTVDLAYSVAAVATKRENAPDYFKIVDAISATGDVIIDRTNEVYNADLGPLWRFYFIGEGLDLLVGKGVATKPMRRAVDLGYSVIVFDNGLALQDPGLHTATESEIRLLYGTTESAFDMLTRLRAL
ncbi:DUF5995 family protein [Nocardia sp. NPDC049707]|uniref:DUF5995 family protein n=1 Tax=Nocardia sp. NPDC049707 TaxID=3154735 RepID=UPI0034473F8C